jgi:hypothetical protein
MTITTETPHSLINADRTREAVELAFRLGWPSVAIGVEGGPGHVHAGDPLAEFALRDGVIHLTRFCAGLDWIDCDHPANDEDFDLPGYGTPWIAWGSPCYDGPPASHDTGGGGRPIKAPNNQHQ